MPNLKRIDLGSSRKLIQIPDLSQCPEVILSHCTGLVQVYSSSFLSKLKCLWLDGCAGLRSLNIPSNVLLRSHGTIVLCDCCNLEMFSFSKANKEVLLHGCSHARSFERTFRNMLPGEIECHLSQRTRSLFEKFSDTFDPLDCDAELNEEPKDNIHLLNLKVLREGSPLIISKSQ